MLMKLTPGDNFIDILRAAYFCMKVFGDAFINLQFGFVIFCRKNIGSKAALKMLIQLTTSDNFTDISWSSFLYESVFAPFMYLTVCNISEKENLRKSCSKNVGEIDYK